MDLVRRRPGTDGSAGNHLLRGAAGPVARPPPRHIRRCGAWGWHSSRSARRVRRWRPHRLERDHLSGLVPDGRGLDGRLAGSGQCLPAGPHPLWVWLRVVPVPGGPVHVPDTAPLPRGVSRTSGIMPLVYFVIAGGLAFSVAVATYFQDWRWPRLAALGVVGATVLSIVLMVGTTTACPGLRDRSGDRRTNRCHPARPAPAADAVHEYHGGLRADLRGACSRRGCSCPSDGCWSTRSTPTSRASSSCSTSSCRRSPSA